SLREMKSGENVFNIPIPQDLDLPAADAHAPTVFQALASRLQGEVGHAPGCEINSDSRDGFAEAVALASRSDVAVLVMGDKAGLTNDSTSGESRDRASLDLPGVQEELVRAVVETGTPVVLVLVGGRPMGSEWVQEQVAAVGMAWLAGAEGAEAIADVLVGAYNPGGKLPISYPRSVGQIPVYHSHKVSGGRSHWKGDYVDSPTTPLYPFGHGLSYTEFRIEGATVEPDTVEMDGSVTVTARVRNVGDRDGEEVVQVYLRDVEASLTRPVSELKAFARVGVPAGQSCTVTFTLPTGQFGFHDRHLDYVVEPGEFEIYVGRSAADRQLAGRFTMAAGGAPPEVAFGGQVTIRSTEEEEDCTWISSPKSKGRSPTAAPTPTAIWRSASTSPTGWCWASAWRTTCGSPSATGIRSAGRATTSSVSAPSTGPGSKTLPTRCRRPNGNSTRHSSSSRKIGRAHV